MKPEKFFSQDELDHEHSLRKDMLPTKTDCLLYVVSRTVAGTHRHATVVRELANEVETIWTNADCCPFTEKHIAKLFEDEVWNKFQFLKREGHLPGQVGTFKRSHKKKQDNSKW